MFTVNRLLLPVKIHYTICFGALAGSIPFLMTYAQQLGASPRMVGILYASLPFMVMVAKPLLGGFADKYQQQKTVFIGCLALMVSGFFSVHFIPVVNNYVGNYTNSTTLHCNNGSLFLISQCPRSSAMGQMHNFTCDLTSCLSDLSSTPFVLNSSIDAWVFLEPFLCEIPVPSISCDSMISDQCSVNCSRSLMESQLEWSVFGINKRIMMLWVSMSIAYIGMGVSLSVGDSLTLDLLGDNKSNFGNQRLFGSLGWGTFSVIAGQLIDKFSVDRRNLNFSPGFYLTLVLGVSDIIVASRIKVIKTRRPKQIVRNVGRLIFNPRVSLFAGAVFVVGMVTGVMWTFLILHLFSLGASQLLIGLALATQCFLGELPFFFVSGWFLRKLGHAHAMTLALFVFGVRFLLYSSITNPWTVLPIELTNGITYGIFFTALATYSSHIAPVGMAATVQGMLQGIYEGFGVGVGCLVGGLLYQAYGGSVMFFICGIFSVICSLLLALSNRLIDTCVPLPITQPFAIEIPEIHHDTKENGAVVKMLNSDGLAS